MHASKIKGQARYVRAVPGSALWRRSRRSSPGWALDARGTQLGVPHPPFIGAYGPRATCWLLVAVPCFAAAVALVPALLRAGPCRLRRGAVRRHGDPAARAQHRPRRHGPLDRALFVGSRAARARTSTCRRWRRSTTARGSSWTASPSSCPRCRCTSAGHPPGLLLTMHYLGLDTAPRLAAFCIVVGALSAPLTYVLAQAPLRGAPRRGSPASSPPSPPRCCTSARRRPTRSS